MAHPGAAKTTFEVNRVIQPIYTGGPVSLSRNGRFLATSLGEDALLTDITNGTRLLRVEGDGEIITSLSLTPSASHLIICSRSLLLKIYTLKQCPTNSLREELLHSLKPHTSPVATLSVDRTGTLIATGSSDGVIKIWDMFGGYVTHTFHGHRGIVSALHFFEVRPSSPEKAAVIKQKKFSTVNVTTDTIEDTGCDTKSYRLASGSEDGIIKIWNLDQSRPIKALDSHMSIVRSLEYDPETKLLLSGSRDKTAILWDTDSWSLRRTIPALEEIEKCGFLKSKSLIYTGGDRGIIRLWDLRTSVEITKEQPAGNEGQSIVDLLYRDQLSFILSVHADNTLNLHSMHGLDGMALRETIPSLPVLRRISGSHDEIIDLAHCGRNQDVLAIATNAEEVRIVSLRLTQPNSKFDFTTAFHENYFGSDLGVLQGHEDIVLCLDVDWSGCWLLTGSKDNTARLWQIDATHERFTCFATFLGHTESIGAVVLPKIRPLAGTTAYDSPLMNPPRFLLTGSQDKTVKRWDTINIQANSRRASRATYTRKAHDKDINAIDVNFDSSLFATASQDRLVKIWSFEDGESIGVLRGHRRGVWSVKFAPHESTPVIGEAGAPINASKGLVLTGSGDKVVKIWSLTDYTCIRTFEGHTNSVLKVIWMKPLDERSLPKCEAQIASAGGDGLVKVWNASSGNVECTLDNHEDRVWALTVDPKTGDLVSGAGDGIITFWKDTTNTTIAAAAAAHTARVEQDQELQNHINTRSYRQAITLALQLNHPARLLSLFTSVASKTPGNGSLCGDPTVDEILGALGDEQLFLLLLRIRDWNTNMRTAPIAQRVLWTLLKSYPPSKFTNLKSTSASDGKTPNVKEVLDGLRVYTERQYRRMEDLIDESYLVEYTLQEMDGVGLLDGQNATVAIRGHQQDVEMHEA